MRFSNTFPTILQRIGPGLCGLGLTLASATALCAQVDALDQSWRWARFTTASGLPSDRVWDVAETQDGVVWAATDAGVAWFDGFQWNALETPDQEPGARPGWLHTDGRGGVWLVMRSRLYHGDTTGLRHQAVTVDGVERPVREAVPLGGDSVLLVVPDPDRGPSLRVFHDGTAEAFDTPSPLHTEAVRALWITHPGRVWLNAEGGLYYREAGRWHLKQAAPPGGFHVDHLAAGPDGSGAALLWEPRDLRGLWEWTGQGRPVRNAAEGQNRIESMDIGPGGDLLALYETGHVRVRLGTTWSSLDPVPEMRGALFFEYRRTGDLWVGTRNGLFLHHGSSRRWTFRGYDFPDARNTVNELMRARDGTVWVGTADGLGIQGTDLTIEWVYRIDGNRLGAVTGLAQDSAGNVWVSSGADFGGAYRWDGGTWRHFGPREGLDAPAVHRLTTDRRGRVWFLGLSEAYSNRGPGAFVLEDGVFTRWGEEQGLPSGRVYAFTEGIDGALWFGTAEGLSRWRDGSWTHWDIRSGLRGSRVFTLAAGDDGRVWFGDMNNGLGYVTPDDEIGYLTQVDGLASDEVWDLAFDARGRRWVAARGGLSSYDHGTFANWGYELGLSNVNLWPVLPAQDSVYVGTMGDGVAILSLHDADLPSHRLLVDPPVVADRRVLARWTALSSWGEVPSANIETRYRVDGGPWSRWSRDHSTTLADLPSGTHTLEVQAKCPLGVCPSGSRTVAFTVPLPLLLRPVVAFPGATLALALAALAAVAVRRKREHDAALRESEQRFRTLVEHAPEAIGIFDVDADRFVDVNDKALAMIGMSREQLLACGPRDLSAPLQPEGKTLEAAIEEMTSPDASDEPVVVQWLAVNTAGEEIPCEVRLARIPSGERRLVRASIIDIREREGIETARRQAEEKFAKAFQSSPDPMAIASFPEGRLVDVNDSFVEMSGYRRDEVVGRTTVELELWAERESRERMMEVLKESGRVRDLETRFRVKDGVLDVRLSGEMIHLGGKPHLLCVAINVTERKQAQERLEESEARALAFSSATFDGICVTEEGIVLDANERLAEMLGCEREALIGRPVVDFVAPESRETVAARQQAGLEEPYEHVAQRADGSVFPVEVRAKAMQYRGRTVRFSVLHDLTQRKRIEEEIRAREDYFRSLIENVDDVITVIDRNGNVQYNSPSAQRLTGFSAGDRIGKPLLDLVHNDDRHSVRMLMAAAFGSPGTPQSAVLRIMRKDGAVRVVESIGTAYRTADGSLIGVINSRDVTERQQMEQARQELTRRIQEQARTLDAILSASPDHIYMYDHSLEYLYVSAAAAKALGKAPADIVGRHWRELDMLAETMVPFEEQVRSVFATGQDLRDETRYPVNGELRHYEYILTPVRGTDGEVEAVLAVTRDITDRKEAEDALRNSEARYREVVEDQTEFIVQWLPDGTRTFVNEAYCQFFGATREELIGTSHMTLIAEEDQPAVRAKIDGLTPRHPTSTDVRRVLRPDGTVGWQEWTDRATFGENGAVVSLQSVGRDITAQKESEEDRRRLEIQLQQASKMEALGTLAGGIAHDFNNMLTAIQGYSELLRDDMGSDAPARYHVDQVLAAAGRARDLVRRILAYSRRSEPELTPVDLQQVVREAVQLLRATLPATIEIQEDLDEHTGEVLADASQIHQVLLNLGSNASSAIGAEGGTIEVRLEQVEVDQAMAEQLAVGPGAYARLVVRDTGCGMDDELQQRIFDPFFTTKEVGRGTGLGLSVVQGIVTKHAGAIQVESEAGAGATFLLYLPLVGERAPQGSEPPVEVSGGSERVLFVDDEDQVATLGGMMLEKLGYAPTVETGSAAALERFRADPAGFDLVIADYTMPEMNGVELARECKRIEPGIPIILATGFAEALTEESVTEHGIAAVIAKPYRVADLAQAIRNALDGADSSG